MFFGELAVWIFFIGYETGKKMVVFHGATSIVIFAVATMIIAVPVILIKKWRQRCAKIEHAIKST